MRRTRPFLIASLVLATPLPAAVQAFAQVTVDTNALNKLGGNPSLPEPPPAATTTGATHSPSAHHTWHKHRHTGAKTTHAAHPAPENTAKAATPSPATAPESAKTVTGAKPPIVLPPAGADTENKAGLGASFATVPVLPGAAPAVPAPPKITVETPAPKKTKKPESAPTPVAPMPPTPVPAPVPADLSPAPAKPATPAPATPPLPASAPAAPAPVTPAPTAPAPAAKPPVAPAPAPAAPAKPTVAAQSPLPPGADVLTLPYTGQDTDASGAVPALIRDFVTRHPSGILYIVRAYATQPKGDDDPSTQRRIALTRAQGVQAALLDAGIAPLNIRLLALGTVASGVPDRVDLIAMPPASGHSSSSSSP